MVTNQGATAGRGFTYQHAYACWRISGLLREGTLIGITLEGNEDIDLTYKDQNTQVTEFIQVKTREEGSNNWSLREFTQLVLAPFFEKKTAQKEFSCFHFVTDGNPDKNLLRLRNEIIPRIIKGEDHDPDSQTLLQDIFEMLKKNGQTIDRETFYNVLKRVRITTRCKDLDTMRALTHTELAAFKLDPLKINEICGRLFITVSHLSGERDIKDRTLTGKDIARRLGLPWMTETAVTKNIHDFKSPAEFWYVHRPEEEELSHYLDTLSGGITQNIMITGESGIGKSSFLNHVERQAGKLDIIAVKLRVLEPSLTTFLIQLADSIEVHFNATTPLVPHDSRNRLMALLSAIRRLGSRPILLLIDQFERLFEEWEIRIDILRIRDLWNKFLAIMSEINKLGQISFILTCRTHYFFLLFPSGADLLNRQFSYLTLQNFGSGEATALLENLLSLINCEMTGPAREIFLEKTELEPQLIILTFINVYSERTAGAPVDVPELLSRKPWNDVFRADIDYIKQVELHKLIIFAMASMDRELCGLDDIVARIQILGNHTRQDVEEALLAIQNTNRRLINQPKKGAFTFYHRKVAEFILQHYRREFPDKWVEQGVVLDVHKMLKEEVRNNRNLHTLINPEKIEIVKKHAEKMLLIDDELKLIAISCLHHHLPADAWVARSLTFDRSILTDLTSYLHHDDLQVRKQAILLLIRFGKEEFAPQLADSIFKELKSPSKDTYKEKLLRDETLIRPILVYFEETGYLPRTEHQTIFWIQLSILHFEGLAYWLRCAPQSIEVAFEPLLLDSQRGHQTIVSPNHLANLFASVTAIGIDRITARFFGYFEPILNRRVEGNELVKDLARTLSPALPILLARTRYLVRQRAFGQVEHYLLFFKFNFNGALYSSRSLIRDEIAGMGFGVSARPGSSKQEIRFLKWVASLLDPETASFRDIQVKLRDLLASSGQPGEMVEAIDLSLQLKDYASIKKLTAKLTKRSNNPALAENAKGLLHLLIELVSDPECLEHLVLQDLASVGLRLLEKQHSYKLLVPLHEQFVEFFQHYLTAVGKDKMITLLKKIHLCPNDFLQVDIRGLILLALTNAAVSMPSEEIAAVCDWLDNAEELIDRSLKLQHEELKGDVLVRRGLLLELIDRSDGRIFDMALGAYEVAIRFHKEMQGKTNDGDDRLIDCAEKLVLLITGRFPGSHWRNVLAGLDDRELHRVTLQLQRNKHLGPFRKMVEGILIEHSWIDRSTRAQMVAEWAKAAIRSKDYETIALCWDFLDEDSMFQAAYSLTKYVPRSILTTIYEKAIKRGNAELLAILVYTAEEDPDNFPSLVKMYSAALPYSDDQVSYDAFQWLATAIRMSHTELFELCWSHIKWNDIHPGELEDWLQDHKPLLMRVTADPGLAEIKAILTSSANPLIALTRSGSE